MILIFTENSLLQLQFNCGRSSCFFPILLSVGYFWKFSFTMLIISVIILLKYFVTVISRLDKIVLKAY